MIENQVFDVSKDLCVSLSCRPCHGVQALGVGIVIFDCWLRIEHKRDCKKPLRGISLGQVSRSLLDEGVHGPDLSPTLIHSICQTSISVA